MNRFILDTNICLAYIRGNRKFCEEIDKRLDLFKPDVQVIISVVTKAELLSLGVQNDWGKNKLNNLKKNIK